MNELMRIPRCTELTMSSREIAEMCGKDHKNVLADIRAMLPRIGKATADFSATALIDGPNGAKREIEVYFLPKRELLVLISGYSIELRARIVDRWQQLEAAANPFRNQLPTDYASALRQLLASVEENERLARANEGLRESLHLAEPKAKALDRLAAADGEMCIRDAAKALQLRPHELTEWLESNRWIYGRPGGSKWTAYQEKIQQGFLKHRTHVVTRDDGSERLFHQVKILAKGFARISLLLNRAQAPSAECAGGA